MSLRRIVVVSMDPEVQRSVQQYGREVFGADDLADSPNVAQAVDASLILVDHRFNPSHIREFLNRADKSSADIPVVALGGEDSDTETGRWGPMTVCTGNKITTGRSES